MQTETNLERERVAENTKTDQEQQRRMMVFVSHFLFSPGKTFSVLRSYATILLLLTRGNSR